MKFTGVCSISFGQVISTIVFKSGKRILAQYKDIVGDAASEELQKIIGEKVDASLSTLNEAQIQLALEFNKTCLTGKGGKAENISLHEIPVYNHQSIKKSPPTPPVQVQISTSKTPEKPGIPQSLPQKRPASVEQVRASELPKIISDAHLKKAAHTPLGAIQQKSQIYPQISVEKIPDETIIVREDTDASSFEKDIETFETMDVDTITNKIRGECKTLIKELNLEHLTEDQ
ncbi:MAG: hypothetical protein LUQ36_07470 [Methanoregula sp.]|nr:hypothetical protein [Methanoregula sp.]